MLTKPCAECHVPAGVSSGAKTPHLNGQSTYQKRCAECHPDNGRVSDHDAPLMAGQNLEYMMEQTRLFVSGKRKFAFMMDDAFRGLSSADLDAVAHFFASQDQFKKK